MDLAPEATESDRRMEYLLDDLFTYHPPTAGGAEIRVSQTNPLAN